jgi:very-short-patch-repair endonuclease
MNLGILFLLFSFTVEVTTPSGKRLIIELDGGQHAENTEYDLVRTLKLNADGFQILRFWNNELFNNIGDVLEMINEALYIPHPSQKTRRSLPQEKR